MLLEMQTLRTRNSNNGSELPKTRLAAMTFNLILLLSRLKHFNLFIL